jgi:hypothetical protein
MEPRTIAIGLIAVIAAFAAAFGISSSGGDKTATAGPGTKAATIKVAAPAAVAGVEVGGTIPALKAEKKAKKKAAKKVATSNPTTSAPTTNNSTPETQAPTTQNTQPTQPTQNTQPSNPQPSTPKPSTPKPNNNAPVSSGGEDG